MWPISPRESGRADERAAADDDPTADADLARHEERVVDADRRAPPVLGDDPGVGVVRDGDGDRDRERPREPRPERHVDPTEVRSHRDDAVVVTHHARDGDPDPDDRALVAGSQLAREVAQVGDDVIDRELPARPIDADLVEGPATQPDDRGGDRVDQDLEAQDDGSGRDEPDQRRRPSGRPETDRVVLGDEPCVGELADQRADRAPCQARGGDELGARLRPQLVKAADDRAQVGAMDRLAALAHFDAADLHDL